MSLRFCGTIGRKNCPSVSVTPAKMRFGLSGVGRLVKRSFDFIDFVEFSTSANNSGSFNCCSAIICGDTSATEVVTVLIIAVGGLFAVFASGDCKTTDLVMRFLEGLFRV